MTQALVVAPSGVSPAADGSQDARLVELWISLKGSPATKRAYTLEAARFLAFLQKPLGAVTISDLQAFATALRQRNLKTASLNRALTAVKSLLSFGQATGYLAYNVGAAVKLKPQRDGLVERILDEVSVAKLIEAAKSGRNRVILRILYVSGVRVSELCSLRWCDAVRRQDAGQITVFGKGGKTRTILLKPNAWNELLALKGEAPPEAPVFRSRKGGPLDVSRVRRIVYAAARKAGLEQRISPHWLRHAHASHALDRHAPIHLVQRTLGHASVATTGRYLHARPSESSGLYLPD